MPLRNVPVDRTRGAPMNNKHKGHRQQKNKAAYAAYRRADVRSQNRDRRMARIIRGLRGGTYEITTSPTGVLNIVRA